MASFDQKLCTLRLMEILLERTDDAHMLNASELCTILDQEYGISTDRRTIYTEMEILETDRKGEDSFRNFDLFAFAKKTFGMYGGVDAEVTLECRNELAGVINDRFGHDVWLIHQGEDHFKARVLVSVSPQFFGWVIGIGYGMIIIEPENVKAEYKAYPQDKILVERALGTLGLLVAEDKKKQRIDIGILDEEGLLMAVVECKASLLSNTEAAFTQAQNYLLNLNTRYYFVTDGSAFDGYYFDTHQFVKLEEIPTYNKWYYYHMAQIEEYLKSL